jgi:hypothetical protein
MSLSLPYSSGGSEEAFLISSGDHSRLETKRITAPPMWCDIERGDLEQKAAAASG